MSDVLHLGRFQERVGDLADESVSLFLTDPPYNLDFDYGVVDDKLPPEEYREFLRDLVALTFPKAKPGGSMFIIHYPEAIAAHWDVLTGNGWEFHQWLSWVYPTHAYGSHNRYRRGHRTILWLSKGEPKFHPRAYVQPYRNLSDKRVKNAKAKGYLGAVHPDWFELPQVKAGSHEHRGYCNQIPQTLLSALISSTTDEGDLVADPCSGTGSTARTALAMGRRAWGCDANPAVAKFWQDVGPRQLVLASSNVAGRDD